MCASILIVQGRVSTLVSTFGLTLTSDVELDFLHCLAWLPGGSWALVMSSQTWGAIISILQDDVENPIYINQPTPNHIKLHVSSRALQHHSKNIPRIHDMTWSLHYIKRGEHFLSFFVAISKDSWSTGALWGASCATRARPMFECGRNRGDLSLWTLQSFRDQRSEIFRASRQVGAEKSPFWAVSTESLIIQEWRKYQKKPKQT